MSFSMMQVVPGLLFCICVGAAIALYAFAIRNTSQVWIELVRRYPSQEWPRECRARSGGARISLVRQRRFLDSFLQTRESGPNILHLGVMHDALYLKRPLWLRVTIGIPIVACIPRKHVRILSESDGNGLCKIEIRAGSRNLFLVHVTKVALERAMQSAEWDIECAALSRRSQSDART